MQLISCSFRPSTPPVLLISLTAICAPTGMLGSENCGALIGPIVISLIGASLADDDAPPEALEELELLLPHAATPSAPTTLIASTTRRWFTASPSSTHRPPEPTILLPDMAPPPQRAGHPVRSATPRSCARGTPAASLRVFGAGQRLGDHSRQSLIWRPGGNPATATRRRPRRVVCHATPRFVTRACGSSGRTPGGGQGSGPEARPAADGLNADTGLRVASFIATAIRGPGDRRQYHRQHPGDELDGLNAIAEQLGYRRRCTMRTATCSARSTRPRSSSGALELVSAARA